MRTAGIILSFMILAGCASPDMPANYAGTDAGYAVIGIGATQGTNYSNYSFLYHRMGDEKRGWFDYYQHNMFYGRPPDYVSTWEAGVVQVVALPPGQYEIKNFTIFFNAGLVQNHFSSKDDFSIPFEIKTGQTVYLGNYQANKLMGQNIFGMPVYEGAYFIVEDRMKIDLDYAHHNNASFQSDGARDATPDVKKMGNPLLVTHAQAMELHY